MRRSRPWYLSVWTPLFVLLLASGLAACGSSGPPEPPENFATNADKNIDGQIVLTWTLKQEFEEDVAKFYIYRDEARDGKFTNKIVEIDLKSGTLDKEKEIYSYTYTDTNVIVGDKYEVPYYYKISSVGNDGKEGPKSDTVLEAKTINYNEPGYVQNIKVSGSNLDDTKIIVSWTPNTEHDIIGYYVFRSDKNEPISTKDPSDAVSKLVEHTKGQQISWVDTKIDEGKPYWYTVVAVDKGNQVGRSRPSERVQGMVLAKAILLSPSDGAEVTNPTFKWKAVDNAVGYVVVLQKSSRGGVIWRTNLLKKTEVTYGGKESLTTGLTYYWYVFAYVQEPKDAQTEDGNSTSELWKFTVK